MATRIAILESDAELRASTVELFAREGHDARGAPEVESGLALVRDWKPALLLLGSKVASAEGMNREQCARAVRVFDKSVQLLLVNPKEGGEPLARALFAELDVLGVHDRIDGPERLLLLADAALKQHAALERLAQQRRGVRHLVEVAARLSRLESLEELFQVALAELRPLAFAEPLPGKERSGLFVFDSPADGMNVRAALGRFLGIEQIGQLDAATIAAVRAGLAADRPFATEKYVLVPMSTRERARGCLILEAPPLSPEAVELCRMYGQQIGQAVESRGLWERATTDGLTRLHNRAFGAERLAEIRSLDRRQKRATSVLLADIDHFKGINDRAGHAAGDYTLRAVANTMRKCGRRSDVTARWGGEEFLMVLPDTNTPSAKLFAGRVRAAVEALRLSFEDREIRPTVSIGCATAEPSDVRDPEVLVAAADRALYAAKDGGRNRVNSWEEESVGSE